MDGLVGLVVGSFQFAFRAVCGIGLVMEATVGQRPTEALVEEQEQQGNLDTFGGVGRRSGSHRVAAARGLSVFVSRSEAGSIRRVWGRVGRW